MPKDEAASAPLLDALTRLVRVLERLENKLDGASGLARTDGSPGSGDGASVSGSHRDDAARGSARTRLQPDAGGLSTSDEEDILRGLADRVDLEIPVERLIRMRNDRFPDSRPRYWAAVDFDLPSDRPRMFVFDVVSRSTASYLCAHGIGSEGREDKFAETFSDRSGSKATSLGIYRCGETYRGDNGYSLRLDGIEPTNSRARARAIVIHGADYVSDRFLAIYKRLGRSEGCPALDHRHARTVIDQLKMGSFLIHWKSP